MDVIGYFDVGCGMESSIVIATRLYSNGKNAIDGLDDWGTLSTSIELNQMVLNTRMEKTEDIL